MKKSLTKKLFAFVFPFLFFVLQGIATRTRVSLARGNSVQLYPFTSAVNYKVGYIDGLGKIVIKPQFEEIQPSRGMQYNLKQFFSEGRALVKLSGKYGYIDDKGRMIIRPTFENASAFADGLALVEDVRPYEYIDLLGGRVWSKVDFDKALPFSEGLGAVRESHSSKYGFVSWRKHEELDYRIPPQFDMAFSFSDGLAAVVVEGKYGYIDKLGKIVIKPQFESAGPFSEGRAVIRRNGEYGYIDKSGEFLTPSRYDEAFAFSEERGLVRTSDRWGYVGKDGSLIITPQFEAASSFSEGRAAVEVGGKWGYIDNVGLWVIEPRFAWAGFFYGGLATVHFSAKSDRTSGKLDFDHQSSSRRQLQLASTRLVLAPEHIGATNLRYGYVNPKGDSVFEETLSVKEFSEPSAGGNFRYVPIPLVTISIESKPPGATIYLVPLDEWESDKHFLEDDAKLQGYIQPRSTPFQDESVVPRVYMVVLELEGRKMVRKFDVYPSGKNLLQVEFQKQRPPT